MKFAHMSDCHLGGWREPKLREAGLRCFERAVEICIREEVDFILISGDLFDSSRPAIEVMERAVATMKEARDRGIRIYVIEGSHDFSPTGKTMTKVLEKTGLFLRTAKAKKTDGNRLKLRFIEDETGVKIAGVVGRWGALETTVYEALDRDAILMEEGIKVLMFHTGLEELKPKEMGEAKVMPVSLLPKGFDYYAGGHIHTRIEHYWEGLGKIVYPGPMFPVNFRELETLESGGFYIVTMEGGEFKTEWRRLNLFEIFKVQVDADGKTAEKVEGDLKERVMDEDVDGKIVLLRVEGTLSAGRPSDVDFRGIMKHLSDRGALLVKKNTSKLSAPEYKEIKVTATTREELEEKLVMEHAGSWKLGDLDMDARVEFIKKMMKILADEEQPGERKDDYVERIRRNAVSALDLEEGWRVL